MDTHAVESLYVALWVLTVEFVYHMTDANVRTDLQRAGYIDIAIAATTPVVVFHPTAMHLLNTTTSMDDIAGVHDCIVQRYQE